MAGVCPEPQAAAGFPSPVPRQLAWSCCERLGLRFCPKLCVQLAYSGACLKAGSVPAIAAPHCQHNMLTLEVGGHTSQRPCKHCWPALQHKRICSLAGDACESHAAKLGSALTTLAWPGLPCKHWSTKGEERVISHSHCDTLRSLVKHLRWFVASAVHQHHVAGVVRPGTQRLIRWL